jgi:beta-mannosidase
VYADDAFYTACDQSGILVWQDFMFACAMYPGDEAFASNVKQEVSDNVNRLKNHACIALWCGNNESDEGWKNWGWQEQYKYSEKDSAKIWKDYVHLFQEVIPETLESTAPGSIYISSSPQIGWGHKESLQHGDSHYWGVWWGMEPFENYNSKVGRFMSEYGFQGMPDLSAFKKFAPENEWNLQSEISKAHQKHPTGYATIQTYMERDYKVPKSFENYVYVSQLLQARGMKTAIEAHRRAKPYCMGTLYWQLNDCWPVTSWSSMDYYGDWKAAHYQAKRSYEDVIISFEEKNDSVYVYLINDRQKDLEGSVSLGITLFSGPSHILPVKQLQPKVKANTSTLLCIYPKTKHFQKLSPKTYMLQAAFICEKESFRASYFFEKPKDLQLLKPSIHHRWLNEATLEIQSDLFAKDVFLEMVGVQFPDNYFDLMPGEKKTLAFPAGQDTGKPLVIKSLFDINE